MESQKIKEGNFRNIAKRIVAKVEAGSSPQPDPMKPLDACHEPEKN